MSYNSTSIQPIWYAKVNNKWLPALPHQVAAVNNYMSTRNPISSVPHPKGGLFNVKFSELIYNMDGSISTTYTTEYGNIVEMIYKKVQKNYSMNNSTKSSLKSPGNMNKFLKPSVKNIHPPKISSAMSNWGNIKPSVKNIHPPKISSAMSNWGNIKPLPHELVPYTDVSYKPYDPSKQKFYGMSNWGGKMKRQSRKNNKRKSIKSKRNKRTVH